ncbi:MAG: HNH endonuclease [Chelatococcus sp.]|uniref:HNH endonuclease n=1 Tax=Chelatococcus sp. TaxID=1953771 RepID=UPI0025C55894|nr:HNH endonuclease [Chelatococcus sp.]MBX3541089.1 HNH endonuclease [Chelatococcus sp.]
MARIFLHRHGYKDRLYALIDDEDAERICRFDWEVIFRTDGKVAYARTNSTKVGKDHKLLHRMVLRAPFGVAVDHANGDGLDNRKQNLRLATPSQNAANSFVQDREDKTSRFKGVSKSGSMWTALIVLEGNQQTLGSFDTEEAAARAYDAAAIRLFGEFARTNEMMGLYHRSGINRKVAKHAKGEPVTPTPCQILPAPVEPWEKFLRKKPLHVQRLHRLRAKTNASRVRARNY